MNNALQRPSLLDSLAGALRDPHPVSFLEAASSLAQATAPDRFADTPLAQHRRQPMTDRAALIESFLDVGERETDALLLVWSAMLDDPSLRERITTSGRRHSLPRWLHQLDQVRPVRALENSHILGDGDNIFIGVETPGRSFTIVVYVDHNMGTIVKDCFIIDVPVREALSRLDELRGDDTDFNEILLEDASAKLMAAIDTGDRMLHPIENDSWPMCKPLVEWMLRLMPTGGEGYDHRGPSDAELSALVDDFAGSVHASALGSDASDQARTLMELASNYSTGDPLRWSNVVAEIMLLDLIPRKIVADDEYLHAMPDTMRALIRFAHERRGIPARYTDEAVSAVDSFEPEYLERIGAPRPMGAAALLAQLGFEGLDDDYLLASLAREVGGMEQLDALTDEPLPDEPLDLTSVPADIAARVTEVGALADAACDAIFEETETRTVVRRMLARVAASDPAIFRRKGRAETAAAALCWIACKANGWLDWGGDLTVAELMDEFGLKGSPAQRAQPMLRALGFDEHAWTEEPILASPDLLISDHRRELIETRDRYRGA